MPGGIEVQDFSTSVFDDEEAVEQLEGHRWDIHRQEIAAPCRKRLSARVFSRLPTFQVVRPQTSQN
jgi:hypothetical protein